MSKTPKKSPFWGNRVPRIPDFSLYEVSDGDPSTPGVVYGIRPKPLIPFTRYRILTIQQSGKNQKNAPLFQNVPWDNQGVLEGSKAGLHSGPEKSRDSKSRDSRKIQKNPGTPEKIPGLPLKKKSAPSAPIYQANNAQYMFF